MVPSFAVGRLYLAQSGQRWLSTAAGRVAGRLFQHAQQRFIVALRLPACKAFAVEPDVARGVKCQQCWAAESERESQMNVRCASTRGRRCYPPNRRTSLQENKPKRESQLYEDVEARRPNGQVYAGICRRTMGSGIRAGVFNANNTRAALLL